MPDFGSKKVRIENVRAIYATASALKVEIDGQEYWFPNSQIDDDSEVYKEGDEGALIVSQWIADQKGVG